MLGGNKGALSVPNSDLFCSSESATIGEIIAGRVNHKKNANDDDSVKSVLRQVEKKIQKALDSTEEEKIRALTASVREAKQRNFEKTQRFARLLSVLFGGRWSRANRS